MVNSNHVATGERVIFLEEDIFCYTATFPNKQSWADLRSEHRHDRVSKEIPLCTLYTAGNLICRYEGGVVKQFTRGTTWSIANEIPGILSGEFSEVPVKLLSFHADRQGRSWGIDPYIVEADTRVELPDIYGTIRCALIGEGKGVVNGQIYDGPQLFIMPEGGDITLETEEETTALVFQVEA